MDWKLLDRPLATWIIAGSAFVVIAFGIPVVRGIVRRRCRGADGVAQPWRHLIGRLNDRWLRITTLVLALVLAVFLLAPDARIVVAAKGLLIVMLAIQAFRFVPVLVDLAIERATRSRADASEPGPTASTLTGLRWVGLIIVYSLILLLALQNLGIDVTALITGLGIGGIAIALALQNILGDLFGSLTIALDKPFVVGDFIIVGSEMGSVEFVGLKTTRVRSLSGEQLVFSNSDLLASRIRNYKRMSQRRVVFGFGVVYSTSPETLEQIPAIVRGAIETQANIRFDRCHFHRFGASSLDFEAVYYIATPDYNAHMDVQQAVHLAIARAFRDRDIAFAFPTQTLHLAGDWGASAAGDART